jgi:uncharacterized protein YaaW (UPF0174 family)
MNRQHQDCRSVETAGLSRQAQGRKPTLDELRAALELATEEELQQITDILFRRRFNPIDYLQTPEPIDIQSRDRHFWLDAIEERFRYLAADGLTVLTGKTRKVTYRQTLIQVCRYLKIPYSQSLSTTDLEAEVFLCLLGKAWRQLPSSEQNALTVKVQRSLASASIPKPLPLSVQKDPLGLLFKGGSAVAFTSVVKPIVLKHIAHQFALHFARYQVAQTAIVRGGAVAAGQVQTYLTAQTAKRGMALSVARYGAARSALALLGPVLWGWFFADLGWRTIATNYGRIIPTIFTLAQIRLTRSDCWEFA